MKILAVDSSSITASVAVVENGVILGETFINSGLTHSQTISPMIESILFNLKASAEEIDLFAVTNGPGSFTGLRIGVATVEGLSLASQKPCIGVSSLEALAFGASGRYSIICACMDARRGQVYNALFEKRDKALTRLTGDRTVSIKSLDQELQKINSDIEFVGDGASMCYNNIESLIKAEKCVLSEEKNRYIRASSVAFLAERKYKGFDEKYNINVDINYINIPQAQRLLEKNLKKEDEDI